ncbi:MULTISPECIES: LysR family transcriptional regulator [unclassified Shinella]|jgi:DNA-binding transcriptional LysR family regulator|uniref:LysR family transcriptional regulator n=1 Tax=unclassified Shinella TaxID=2643062 RepID=UPI00234F53C8|nr:MULTISPECIES: LysR family transcriptional regulator [unclassified Shinella]MCO5150901.1 LysR family transcriptional regulator [Shinella sp.]MDC7263088.1 LysR family transcriptional regulator [Shinella sp. HY16]MDC7269983.1 LysR family transcriptional regulator [Shinella sp. YZ44]
MNTLPYSLDDLYWFALIAGAGSLSRASREYDVAKSTLSRRLARLEEAMGITLIQRNAAVSGLTDAGRKLFEEAQPLIRHLETYSSELIGREGEPAGVVRLSASGAFGHLVVLPIVLDFMCRYPRVDVEMEMTDRRVDLVANAIDIAVRIGVLADSDLSARKVATARRVLCASAGYAKTCGLPTQPDDLENHDFLTQSRNAATLELRSGSRTRTITIRRRLLLAPSDELLVPVQAGLGIAHLAEIQCARHLASGELVRVLPDWDIPAFDIYLVSPNRRYRPRAVRLLMEELADRIPIVSGELVPQE